MRSMTPSSASVHKGLATLEGASLSAVKLDDLIWNSRLVISLLSRQFNLLRSPEGWNFYRQKGAEVTASLFISHNASQVRFPASSSIR